MTNTDQLPNVNIKTVDDLAEAQRKANDEAANTAGFQLPGIMFTQGNRRCISTAFPINRIRTKLKVDEVRRQGTVAEVQQAMNRPIMKGHVKNIAAYLRENVRGSYILPPMTLNVQETISVYVPDYEGRLQTVYLVVPETVRLSVTDGGHRTAGVTKACEEMSIDDLVAFDQDAVSVMITLENDITKVHQDFADCSKTKALPKSQLAAYDRRNPANGLVLDLIDRCLLFKDKIDSTSKTLSKTSTNLFLTNQVRQLVKALLVGDHAMADDVFETKAKELLVNNEHEQYATELAKFEAYVNRVTESIPILKEIAGLPPGMPRNRIKDLRGEGSIILTATGMNIIGRIGHELFRDRVDDWETVADLLGTVDWSRGAEMWQGNIIRAGKITTQRAPVRMASEMVRRYIGLPQNHKLDEELIGMTPKVGESSEADASAAAE